MRLLRNDNLLFNARDLRKDMTKAEKHLWYDFLSNYPIRFRRQEIIDNYIADFYCSQAKLIIELDGDQHADEKAIEYDLRRTEYFNELGITVIRFSNYDIKTGFENVCMEIDRIVKERLQDPSVTS